MTWEKTPEWACARTLKWVSDQVEAEADKLASGCHIQSLSVSMYIHGKLDKAYSIVRRLRLRSSLQRKKRVALPDTI